jgi:3-carboxy-cis,cis-muconate cycloisomerase
VAGSRGGALAVQLGGPVGTLADFGERAPELVVAYAERLGLAVPPMTWHAQRARPLQVAAALGIAAGACAKVGRDVILLAQPEVGEVEERIPGSGGSSSMTHKHNPIGAISAAACAERVPGLVATLFASAEQEHQRAAGRWHAEWPGPLVALAGSAAAWIRDSLTHLAVHPERMAANLELAATDPATTDRYLAAAAAAVDRAIGARKGSDLP